MKSQSLSIGVLALAIFLCPALAADDDDGLARMALCKDSWVDWSKSDPAKMNAFADRFRAQFSPHDNDPFWLPKGNVSVMGLRVSQAFPDSVGMGVGLGRRRIGTVPHSRFKRLIVISTELSAKIGVGG